MGEHSSIEWCDATFNAWEGCEKVSPACKNCYAETRAIRWGHSSGGKHLPLWGPGSVRKFRSDAYWREPLKWNRDAARAGGRHRVFCMSLGDVFEVLPDDHPDAVAMDRARQRLWNLIERTANLDWLLLTKRPENLCLAGAMGVPLPSNVWLGTTVENQETADERIPHLLRVPARVRFLSCEPLLAPVRLDAMLLENDACGECAGDIEYDAFTASASCGCTVEGPEPIDWHRLDWVIAGGETGPSARPSHPDWFRSLRDQCAAADVPFFFKQWGEHKPEYRRDPKAFGLPLVERMVRVGKKAAGCELDGDTWKQFPQVTL
ncbi:MAG: phage Gp37/Gp68 family protein [Planctomycetota bacterium]